ncbi:MAG: hypothetical protein ACRDG3_12450, partial [Tepidiformaceae bacterium]
PTASATSTPRGQTCGNGHAALLGFADAGVASITRTPIETSVGALRTLAGPSPFPTDATRLAPFETTVYSLTANLVSMSQLSDGTIVLLVGDISGGATVPVFLPPRSCTNSADPGDQGAISGAAIALREACGDAPAPGAGPQALAGSATITGTGFWSNAKVDGAPANGASLGPVLSLSFSGGSCDPSMVTPTPTPSPTPSVERTYAALVNAPVNITYTAGDTASVKGIILPAEPGVTCDFLYTGPNLSSQIQSPEFLTDATGNTQPWIFTIPADSPAGDGEVTAYCGGHPGTASLRIHAAS